MNYLTTSNTSRALIALLTLPLMLNSLPSHANVVTSKDLKSCINNCIAVHSCEPAKGKKHAKKIQKKRATASVKTVQKEEVKACEKVTEYIFLPAFEEAHRLPNYDYQMQRDTPIEEKRERAPINFSEWPTNAYIPSYIFANYGQLTGIKLPKVPERGIPINPPIPTPLPASVFLFASGLAIIVRRSKQ